MCCLGGPTMGRLGNLITNACGLSDAVVLVTG